MYSEEFCAILMLMRLPSQPFIECIYIVDGFVVELDSFIIGIDIS